MDAQTQIAIITTLLTALGGVVGYAIREYLNRVKPFIAVEKVEGGLTKSSTQVDVPETVVDAIRNSYKIHELDVSDKLKDITEARDDCKNIIENSTPFLNLVKKVIDYATVGEKTETIDTLSKMISTKFNRDSLVIINILDRINVPDVNPSLPIVIPSTYSAEKDSGTLWIGFPRNTITFGWNFSNYPLHRQKCERFVGLIQTVDLDGIKLVFEQIKTIVENEISIAKDCMQVLENIVDENSRWEIQIYLANLNNVPFLIRKKAILHIKDETQAEYHEPCDLCVIKEKSDGTPDKYISDSPLVVGGGRDALFAFITSNTQREMKRGKAFRDTFVAGSGYCWIEFEVEKVGLIRNSKIKLSKVPFKES